ncbi:MAG: hypothetical protein JW828_10150 [Sedimentisphaerales bacterium]|nr:hypothetical protein [Sedimentisphaerales bacterium]
MKSQLRYHVTTLCLVCFSALLSPSLYAEQSSDLERQFIELPMEARRLTGPLFWLHGDESKEHLEMYVEKVAEGGNGSFTAESRPHIDWLGEGWYRDLQICLDAAKKNNLKMWIFDEKWWPSQGVAGKVPPRYAAKTMAASAMEVAGPKPFHAEGYTGDRYIATVAGRVLDDGKIDGETLLDLEPNIQDGNLSWQAPAGKWRIMKFTHVQGSPLGQNGQLSVDGASKDCVDWFIRTVYQPHYDRFKDDFGTWIPGFFYDEPETRGDWGTELNATLAEWGVDWKKAYVAYKFELSGDEQAAAKYQYLDAFAETWGRTMYGGITDWCHKHNVLSIGHFMEHGSLYIHPEFCAGDMMRLQKYSDMGGIDAVFRQFIIGQKKVPHDEPTWQTPKLGSSISHVYGKTDDIAMVEIFGARGQDLTYPEMKWWIDHMQVSGINFTIPHSFNPKSPFDTDCPPYFYNNGYEPRWPLYRVITDYSSRLTLMLTGGRHVCPVALLFAGNTRQVGRAVMPENMTTALQDALFDCDWLPFEVFEREARLNNGKIALHQERYQILIVPPVEVIPYPTLAKAKQFFDQGGIVLGYGFLPTRSATIGKNAQDIAALRSAIWGHPEAGLNVCKTNTAGGRSYLLPLEPTPEQIQQVLTGDANIHPTLEVIEGKTNHWLHVLHRVKDGRDIFFLCNQNTDGGPRKFRIRVTADGFPECWDPLRAEITSIPFIRQKDKVDMSLTLQSNESLLLVFNNSKRDLPCRIEFGELRPLRTLILERHSLPEQPLAVPPVENEVRDQLKGLSWIWYPEPDPASKASAGTCYFRKEFDIPSDRKIHSAQFVCTADNSMRLWINGVHIEDEGSTFNDWNTVCNLDISKSLRTGQNTVAISVINATDQPNPAGLIGKIVIVFEGNNALKIPIDRTWKTEEQASGAWQNANFDDSHWKNAVEFAVYGTGPWGTLGGRRLTLSPIQKADPFVGQFMIPNLADLKNQRILIEMQQIEPEAAARITVNNRYAGGIIEKPFYLDISEHVKEGKNTIRIEPFAPEKVRIALYPR